MKLNSYVRKSLSRQYVALMGAFLGFFLVGSIILLVALNFLVRSYTDENNELEKKESLAQEINTTYNRAFFDARGYLAFNNLALKENAIAQEKKIREMEKRFEEMANVEHDQIFLNTAYQFTDFYFVDTLPVVFEKYEKGDLQGAVKLANKQATPRVNHFQGVLQNYVQGLDKELEDNFDELTTMQTYAQIVFVIFILTILLILLKITRLMFNRVGLPLSQFAKAANDFSIGKSSPADFSSDREDEIGSLSIAFQKMAEKVQEKEQDLLAQNEELLAQQDELQAQQNELEGALAILQENEKNLNNRNELIDKISKSLIKQEVLDSIVINICKIIEADRGIIALLKDGSSSAFGISEFGVEQFKQHLTSGLNSKLIHLKKPFTLKRELEAAEKGFHTDPLFCYDLYIPILTSTEEITAIMVFSRFSLPFLAEQMGEYEALAKNISISLDKIQLYEKSEAERKLNQGILNTVHEGILLIDKNRSIIQVNSQMYDLFGFSKNDKRLVGMSWEEWPELLKDFVEDEEEFHQFLKEATDCNRVKPIKELSFVYQRKNSKQVLKVYCEDLYRGDEKSGTVMVHRDITKEFEVDQMKSEFVSTVSHELRTPLASILGFTELMLNRELKPDKQKKYLTTIFQEAKRLTSLINDFLDVQRMEAGKQVYEQKYFELMPLLEKLIEIQKVNAPLHTLKLQSLEETNSLILGDKSKLEQVFTNLIGNAIKYSPQGGNITVTILKMNNQWRIDIEDEGLGIPEDSIEKIFTKFYRVDNSDRRKIGGTGLGLSIVHEIMKAHGGDVTVKSVFGKGSTFSVFLPVLTDQIVLDESGQLNDRVLGYYIMVVEDDKSLAQLINQELNESGFQTTHYTNGRDALRSLEKEIPDAIVLDIMLAEGGIDGWGVMKEIKNQEHLKDIPIIVSTALDEKEKGISLGASDFLVKPYKPSNLSKAIMQTLLNFGKVGQVLIPEENRNS